MKRQIIRQIDETGRIVLPKPFRELIGVGLKDDVVISCENDAIIIRRTDNACVFCGKEASGKFGNTAVCTECATEIAQLAKN